MINLGLIFILFGTFLLRLPSLLEPFWYGDEGVYMAVGQAMLKGLSLYTEAFDNKPPAIYLLSALSTAVFGHSIWSLRLMLMIWVLATQVVIYFLGKKLFDTKKAGYIAAIVFGLLTATPLIEGNIANGELFFILFTSLGFLQGLRGKYVWAGVSFALGLLFKAPAVFDFMAFGLTLLLWQRADTFESLSRRIIKTALGFAVPLVLVSGYFFLRNHFQDFYFSVLSSNVGYTDYGNRFLIPNGLLIIKALGLLAIVGFFFRDIIRSWLSRKRRPEVKLTTTHVLVLWLFFGLYGALFGGRNYSHYLIQIVPPVTLLLTGLLIKGVTRRLATASLLATLVIVTVLGFRPTYFKTSYYNHALSYLFGKMDQTSYNLTFDRKVSRNYTLGEVAKRLSTDTDTIYVWANEPQVYFLANRANSHRYTAAYHTSNYQGFEETMHHLNQNPPRIIIIERPEPYPFPALETFVKTYYSFAGDFEDAQIYRLNSAF